MNILWNVVIKYSSFKWSFNFFILIPVKQQDRGELPNENTGYDKVQASQAHCTLNEQSIILLGKESEISHTQLQSLNMSCHIIHFILLKLN
jgi:hypothetical protein